jgi:hypothetical protein
VLPLAGPAGRGGVMVEVMAAAARLAEWVAAQCVNNLAPVIVTNTP